MPKNACHAAQALDVSNPCDNCTRRSRCMVFLSWRLLFESANEYFQKHLISACSEFVPHSPVYTGHTGIDISNDLKTAGVPHLCTECPETDGSCDTHEKLERIRECADANGIRIAFTTYACKTKLIQIGQSRT